MAQIAQIPLHVGSMQKRSAGILTTRFAFTNKPGLATACLIALTQRDSWLRKVEEVKN